MKIQVTKLCPKCGWRPQTDEASHCPDFEHGELESYVLAAVVDTMIEDIEAAAVNGEIDEAIERYREAVPTVKV